jgi:hypothetical protein
MKKSYYYFLFILLIIIISKEVKSQTGVSINTDGTDPDASAILDVKAIDKGLLIPRMDLAARNLIGTPATGLLIFQTDATPGFYFYNGTSWEKIADGNVLSASLDNGKIFVGNISNTATGVDLSGDATINSTGVVTISNDAINNSKILNGAVTTSKIADNAIDGTKINLTGNANGDLMYYNGTDWVRLATGSNGEVLKITGGIPAWGVDANNTYTGSTSVTLNAGSFERAALTGDVTAPTNSNATTISNNAVTTVKINNDAVDNTKLSNMATQTLKGRNTAGTGDPEDLTAAQVRTILNVADGANNYVHPNHTGDVTSASDGATTITNNAVTTAKIANDAVNNTKLADMATQRIKGRNTAGTGDPEDLTAAQVRTILNVADGANNYTHPNHTGDVTSTGDGVTIIANNAVTNAKFRQSEALSVVGRSANSTGNVADIAASADGNVLRRSGTTLGFGTINLASVNAVNGTLPVTNGGTGVATIPVNGVMVGNGASPVTTVAPGASGNILLSNGTSWTSNNGADNFIRNQNTAVQATSNFWIDGLARIGNGTVAAPSLSFNSNPTTGLFRSAANVIGFSSNGVERMRLTAQGGLQIGVQDQVATTETALTVRRTLTNPNATRYGFDTRLIMSDGTALTANRSHYGTYNRVDNLITDLGTNPFTLTQIVDYNYWIQNQPDVKATTGRASFNYAHQNNASAIVTTLQGSYNQAYNQSGTNTTLHGAFNYALTNVGTSNTMYGAYNHAYINNAAGSSNSMFGAYNYARYRGTGTIANIRGSYHYVHADANAGTVTNAYAVQAQITQASTQTITNGYLFRGAYTGTIGNKWGVYVTGETNNYLSGNLGIGTTAPTAKLHVNGTIRSNAINETSDIRFKKEVNEISESLDKVMKMKGVTYYWRRDEFPDNNFNEKLQYGLIAQDLEKVIPELVETDIEGWKSIEYSHIVPLLIEAIKEQQAQINHYKNKIEQIQLEKNEIHSEKLNSLTSQNNLLEKRLSEFELWKTQLENSLPKSMLPNKD